LGREQVVDFILKNTGGAVQAPPLGQYVDPYTGAAAYVPTGGGGGASSGGGGGGGSYGVTGGGADPFTGGGAAPPRHLPAKNYLVYDQVGSGLIGGGHIHA
jgi:phospholipase A-2-activating protein